MNLSLRNIIIGIIVAVLAVAIPVTLRLAREQQQLKSKAAAGWQCNSDSGEFRYCISFVNQAGGEITVGSAVNVFVVGGQDDQSPRLTGTVNLSAASSSGPAGKCNPPDSGFRNCWIFVIPNITNQTYSETFASEISDQAGTPGRVASSFAPPPPPPPPGNVGVGAEGSRCNYEILDQQTRRASTFLESNKSYIFRITMTNGGSTTWDQNTYKLKAVSPTQSNWQLSKNLFALIDAESKRQTAIGPGSDAVFEIPAQAPTVDKATNNPLNFIMQNAQGTEFGSACNPTNVEVFPPGIGGPGAPACDGAAGFQAGADRVWRCVGEDPLPQGCVGGSKDANRACTSGLSCYACLATAAPPPNTYNFGQCGVCRNNPKTQTEDPNCDTVAAIKDDNDDRCRRKVSIDFREFKDKCIDAQCVSASKARDCLICHGSQCQTDASFCIDPQKPICEANQPNRGFCVASQPAGGPPPPPTGAPTCNRFELTGLTRSSTNNSEGGPIYQASSSGSNNQFDLSFTPSNASIALTPISQTTGAPDLRISEVNTGSGIVRVANIPPNTSATLDNTYLIRATVSSGAQQVNCLPIQVIVPNTTGGPGPPVTTCPSDIQSTEVKFRNADGSGSWTGQKTITLGQTVRVGGFHNKVTPDTPPSDIGPLTVSGPNAFSTTHQNGAIFTPPADLPAGAYVFTAQTTGKTGNECTGTATLVVGAAPAPVKNTLCFAISDNETVVDAILNCSNIDNKVIFPYTGEPTKVTGFTLTNQTTGVKFVFVKFIGTQDSAPVTKKERKLIKFDPNPQIATANCTHSALGSQTLVTITGSNFGPQGKGKVKIKDQEVAPDSWNSTTSTITATADQRLEGKIAVEVTIDDGRVAKGECVVNTTTAVFRTILQCKPAGNFSASNVDVKVFESQVATTQAITPQPLLQQKISLDKDGNPQGFAPKFEKKKKYQLIIKAPQTLAKRVDFDTQDGGTVNLNSGNPVTLTQGDIAPANALDGKINAFDKSELIRQWSLVTDVSRTGDLTGDNRVNSLDWACMRQNINQEDEKFTPLTVSTAPPLPTSTAPIIPAGT